MSLAKAIRLAIITAAVAAIFAPGSFAARTSKGCIVNAYRHDSCLTHHVRPTIVRKARTASKEKVGMRRDPAECFTPYTHLLVRCIPSVPSQPS